LSLSSLPCLPEELGRESHRENKGLDERGQFISLFFAPVLDSLSLLRTFVIDGEATRKLSIVAFRPLMRSSRVCALRLRSMSACWYVDKRSTRLNSGSANKWRRGTMVLTSPRGLLLFHMRLMPFLSKLLICFRRPGFTKSVKNNQAFAVQLCEAVQDA